MQQPPGYLAGWPPHWTQADVLDWASMSFGPPAPAPTPGMCQQWTAGKAGVSGLWVPSDCQWTEVGIQMEPPMSMYYNNDSQQQQQHHHHHHKAGQLGKRNSLARSTLPMVAQANVGQTILAPPYNPAHDESTTAKSHVTHHQLTSSAVICPPLLYAPPPGGNISVAHQGQARLAHLVSSSSAAADLPPVSHDADDPVTANACLGSYKRKRRLPHIEAQFTITKAPELPPKQAPVPHHQNQSAMMNAERLEREAMTRGHLFVREVANGGNGEPATPGPPPLGLPQPGQRSEQRRLRSSLSASLHLQEVEKIDAREKIETYLRHYEHKSNATRAPPLPPLGQLDKSGLEQSELTIEVDQVDEVTFQPYYNLPSLKYTISLPLRKQQDGTLMFERTSHLKPRRASLRDKTSDHNQRTHRKKDMEMASNQAEPVDRLQDDNVELEADYSSVREDSSLNLSQQPPPPVPPHRTSNVTPQNSNPTNSTDENYEFDQVSSCSSIATTAKPAPNKETAQS